MTLKIHDTLSRTKQEFVPIDPEHIKLYVCGPTVYDYAHIGNARPVVVFDTLVKLLRHLYPKVTYVRNITDIDDKINTASLETGEDIRSITNRTAQAYHEDMDALNADQPDVEPRATEHVPQMISMIEKLIELGNAYAADGHVLFNVPSMKDYGKLSKLDKREIVAGARIDVAPYKKNASDFVLWKPSAPEIPGWDSPWGRGRPGWHIECSAMSEEHLGTSFDIHGGGLDLIFPHHENEIAQSTCANGHGSFAKYWMHNGYLMSEGEKMSKSLGNFYTVHDLLEEFPGEAIRLTLLTAHYRQPLDFTRDGIAENKRALDKFYGALRNTAELGSETVEVPKLILETLCEDLNTPKAISHLHELLGELNKASSDDAKKSARSNLLAAGEILGLLGQDPDAWCRWQPSASSSSDLDDNAIDDLILKRNQARKDKDFATADQVRDQLNEANIILEDSAEGTTWRRG